MAEKTGDIVSNDERVARVIFSPSYIYKGKVAPTAFRWETLPSGAVEDFISVLRCQSEEAINEQTKSFRPRTEGDSRYGYTVLGVDKIRNIKNHPALGNRANTDVLPFLSKRLANHAGIVVDLDEKRVAAKMQLTPEIMFIQKMLAAICSDIRKF